MEISLLFLGFIDDDVIPLLFSLSFLFIYYFFFVLLPHLVHFMFPIALIWQVLPHFGFVTMMLHFVITFSIAMT